MVTMNVVAFPMRRKQQPHVSTPTSYDEHGWLEIEPLIYDWFIRHPNEATLVHEYGFLHQPTRRAFICLTHTDNGFVCGMSNRAYSDDEFEQLRSDEAIDAVIERLGYEPTTTT